MKSRKKIIVIVVLALALILIAVLAFLATREETYRNVSVLETEGTASLERNEVEMSIYAQLVIQSEDKITTGDDGLVSLMLDDDKYAIVEESSEVIFELAGKKNNGSIRINLNAGSIYNDIENPLDENDSYEIVTPDGVMAVRGTKFRVSIVRAEDGSYRATIITVFDGKVYVQVDNSSGEDTMVEAGEEAVIMKYFGNEEQDEEEAYLVKDGDGSIDYSRIPQWLLDRLGITDEESGSTSDGSSDTEGTEAGQDESSASSGTDSQSESAASNGGETDEEETEGAESGTKPGSGNGGTTKSETESESEAGTEPESGTGTEAESGTEDGTESGSESESGTDTESGSGSDSDTDSDSGSGSDADTDSDSGSESDDHSHTYVYAAESTTITESCAYCSEHSASVTLSAPSGTLVYDGTTLHEAELTYTGTLSDGNNLTVTYQKDGEAVTDTTGAGTYTATVTLGTESVSVEYTVEKAEVTAPIIDSKVYSGENQTADVAASELYEVSENAGGTEAGTYQVVLKLTDSDNYQWSTAEGTVSGDELTLSFTITEGQNAWTSELSMSADSWVYGDTAGTPAAAAEYGDVVYTYYTADYTSLGSTQPTDAGTYYVQASVAADGVNYEEIVSDYVEFTIVKADLTVTWPENLTGSAGETLSSVSLDDYTATDGNGTFTWDDGDTVLVYGSNEYAMTYTPDDTDNYNELQANVTVYGNDVTAPTAEISVDTNTWKSLLNTITFGLFFKETQTVTITASDDESGVAGIYYYLSNTAVETDETTLSGLAWTEYSSLSLSPENTYVIYVKAVDGAGNAVYISSDGLVLDSLAPVFNGINDQGVYCGSVSFTVTDECEADTNDIIVTVDGSILEPDSSNTYTITASGQDLTCQVEATDSAGNCASISITVNQDHTCVYEAEGTTITESCAYCSEHSASVTLSAPSGTLVYDGTTLHEAELSYTGTFSDGNNLTVAYQKDGEAVTDTSGAGTYTATVTLGTESVSVEYTVEKAEVTAPTIDSKVYSGENQTADVAADTLYEVSENAGGTDVGTYQVVLKLTDSDNYQWSTASGTVNGDELTLSFTITEEQNVWTSELSMSADSWVYGDTAGTPAAAAEYGEVVYAYYTTDYTNLGSTQPTDAGTYYVQASVAADGDNYGEIISDYVEFTIEKRAVTLVWSDAAEMNLVYDGTAKTATVTLENVVEGDDVSAADPVCLSGDTTNVTAEGFLCTVTELTGADSANYELPDSTESEAYYITAVELTNEDFTVDTADQTYTGSAITLSYTCNNTLITENDYILSYESNINVGDGQLVITGTGNFTGELTYPFAIVKADLTVTWPENLTGSAGDTLSSVSLDDYTTADGKGAFTWDAGDTVLVYGSYEYAMTYTPNDTDNYEVLQASVVVYGNDVTVPTAQISVDTNLWKSLLNSITFGIFFQETQTVTITATDDESGVAGMYYYLANTAVEADETTLSGLAWTEYSSFSISPENTYVIYVKAVDGAGNTTYISSEGLVLDSLAPVFNGVMDQGIYCGSVSFTVTDECAADTSEITVTVDGSTLEPDSDNTYTITAAGQDLTCQVEATDSAGNSAVISITVNQDHTYVYEAEGTTITESCEYCHQHSASVTLSAPSGTLVYDGATLHEAELSYTGTLSGGNNLTVTYQKDGASVTDTSGAGTYTATVTLGGETVSVEYTVEKAEVTAPTMESKVYSGENQTADVAADTLYEVSENAGGTDVGTYPVVLKLTDSDNYQWSTASGTVSGDELTLSFEITAAANAWTQELTIAGWTYGETAESPGAAAEFGSDTIVYTYYSEAGGTALASQPTAAGTWYVQATIAATDNYSGLTSGYVSFTIARREVTLTWSELDESSLVYDGTEKTVTVTLGNLVSGDDVSADTGLTGDNVNVTADGFSYSVTELTGNSSGNYVLPSDVSSAGYVITAKPLSQDLFSVDETDQAYTGSEVYVSASANNTTTMPGSNYTITFSDNVEPGQATVIITGMNNYQGTLTYHFNIIMTVTVPSADTTVYTYNGGEQTYGLTESAYYEITGNVQTDAGTYTVTVSLKNTTYYKWSDNTTNDKTYTFTIEKATVEVPTIADREYTGGEQPSGLSSTEYTVSENETEHINVGTYTVDLTLTNENYQWSGNADSDTVTVSYYITRAENGWLSELSITGWTYGSYDASLNAPSITAKFGEAEYSYYWYSSYSESYYEISDITQETGGTFYVKATVSETENYQGLESDYVEFTVNGTKQLTEDNFTLPESVTYTGEALEPLVANDTQQTYTATYENNIEPGTATVIITGTGDYTGSVLILYFEIVAADSASASVSSTLSTTVGGVELFLLPVLCSELFLNAKKRKEKL